MWVLATNDKSLWVNNNHSPIADKIGAIPCLMLFIPSFYSFIVLCKIWHKLLPIIKPKLAEINHDIIKTYNNYSEDEFDFMFNVFGSVIHDIKYVLFFSKLYSIILLFILPLPYYIDVMIVMTFIKPHFILNDQITIIIIMSVVTAILSFIQISCIIGLWFKSQRLTNILSKYLKRYDYFQCDNDCHVRRNSIIDEYDKMPYYLTLKIQS